MGGFDPPKTPPNAAFLLRQTNPRMPGGGCGLSAVAFLEKLLKKLLKRSERHLSYNAAKNSVSRPTRRD